MRRRITLLFLIAALLSACTGQVADTDGTDAAQVVFQAVEAGRIYSSVTPPEAGEGVWYVENEQQLQAVDFNGFSGVPVLCITAPIVLKEPYVISRPVTLYYSSRENDAVCFYGAGLIIEPSAPGQISVFSTSAHLLSTGFLTVDAPRCGLTWEGDMMPEDEDFMLYCNVGALNGIAFGPLGGTAPAVSDIRLLQAKNDKPYEGSTFSLYGNVIYFGYPLLAGDAELEQARVRFTTGDMEETLELNLNEEHTVTLQDGKGDTRTYKLIPYRQGYGLPVIQLYTEKAVTSKISYVGGEMRVDGQTYTVQVKGRGNASWNKYPKKSYRIKLDGSESLFGLAENRDWVLTSNYGDKSLIRNCVAHEIASVMDGLEFTSTHISVNFYLNGEYLGVYTFADKIEVGSGRLDISEDPESPARDEKDIGFLIEFGWDYQSANVYARDFFDTKYAKRMYVKEPEITQKYSADMNAVMSYVQKAENAIVSGKNWQDYVDMDSWVDWFIVTELTMNTESAFYRSCYIWRKAGGKLMLGPVWDFDKAFGNHSMDIKGYRGWCTTETPSIGTNWLDFLIRQQDFKSAVKTRWNEKKDELLATALAAVDSRSAELEGSWQQNFTKWNILAKKSGAANVGTDKYTTYEGQIEFLRDFITDRWNYMDERINREF